MENNTLTVSVRGMLLTKVEQIACVAHEVNRAYCKCIGDDSQPSWEDAPQWQKDSAINGVMFTASNPQATPENSHESWMREKAAAGWVWGPVKDPELKQHPCFIPYDQLSEQQRCKDHLFQAAVRTLLGMVS